MIPAAVPTSSITAASDVLFTVGRRLHYRENQHGNNITANSVPLGAVWSRVCRRRCQALSVASGILGSMSIAVWITHLCHWWPKVQLLPVWWPPSWTWTTCMRNLLSDVVPLCRASLKTWYSHWNFPRISYTAEVPAASGLAAAIYNFDHVSTELGVSVVPLLPSP